MNPRSLFSRVVLVAIVSGYGGGALAQTPTQSAAAPQTAPASQTPQAVQTKPSAQSFFGPPQPHTDAPPEPVKRYPGDGDGAYKTGKYRDLFAERGHSAQESRARVDAAFEQLFHGDKDTQAIYYEAGSNANGPLAYITDVANHDARTEGMSYGMMIAVQLDKKREFDAIWNWANTYMLVTDPQNPSVGYFAWSMNVDGTPRSDSAAPDGEEYFTMALYFAANRWGNGTGIYNYKEQADRILALMRHHPTLTGTRPFRIHPGDEPFVRKPRPLPPGATAPPPRPAQASVGPMLEETLQDDSLRARYRRRGEIHRSFVSLAGVLRIVGALGTGAGSRVLGGSGGCEQKYFCEGDRAGDGPYAGSQPLR